MNELETNPPAETVSAETACETEAAADALPADSEPAEPLLSVSAEEFLPPEPAASAEAPSAGEAGLRAMVEAIVYVTEEPVTAQQIATALEAPKEKVEAALRDLAAEYEKPAHGIGLREVAGGYSMATKAEHHDAVRTFAKSLKAPLKLSLAALETLAVVAYKQPVTSPEIMEIRGVQGAGVLKTLLDRKLIQVAGRKNVIGKPVLYKTTKEFLLQFGLKDLAELPTLKEFEELRRLAMPEDLGSEAAEAGRPPTPAAAPEPAAEPPIETSEAGPAAAGPAEAEAAGSE